MEETIDFEEFDSGFDTGDGYQTDGGEDAADNAEIAMDGDDPGEPGTEGAADDTADGTDPDDDGGADDTDPPADQSAESFTLKVNKETRTVSREEVISLAQKGADYDRVKQAHERVTAEMQELRTQNAPALETYAVLSELAQIKGITVEALVEDMQISHMVQDGTPRGEAKERLARQKLEKENAALRGAPAKTEAQKLRERADGEIAEFRQAYPDVTVDQALVDALMADVQNGMTLVQAYQKRENARLAEENRKLQQALEAERKNKKNRSSTPGSMGDSGRRKSKDMFDEFFEALG